MTGQLKITLKIMPEFLGPDRARIGAFCDAVARQVREAFPEAAVVCLSSSWADTVVEGVPEDDPGQEDVIRELIAEIVGEVFQENDSWRTLGTEEAEEAEVEPESGPPVEPLRETAGPAAPPASVLPVAEAAGSPEPPDLLDGGIFFKWKDLYTVFLPNLGLGIRLNARARKHRATVTRSLPDNPANPSSYKGMFGGVGWHTTRDRMPPKVLDEMGAVARTETEGVGRDGADRA